MPWWRRIAYRVYRHPAFLFGLAPAFLFLLQYRVPVGLMGAGRQPWVSTMGTNLAIAATATAAIWAVGPVPFLAVHVPIVVMAATIGVWLFFVQHQFEETYWAREPEWGFQHSALHGSSHYDLPPVLRWLTGHIGVHHVHHISPRIPNYKLQECHDENPLFHNVTTIRLRDTGRALTLYAWFVAPPPRSSWPRC